MPYDPTALINEINEQLPSNIESDITAAKLRLVLTDNVSATASGLADSGNSIIAINANIATIEGEIDVLQSDVFTIDGEITTLNSEVATNTSNIATNTSAISTLNSEVGTLLPGQDTLTNLQNNFHPVTAPAFLQTTGYAAHGDFGAALYVKVNSQPSHKGKMSLTLANSSVVWYSITADIVRPEMFGPTDHHATDSTSATNNTAAIQAAIDYFGASASVNAGKVLLSSYAINGTINIQTGITFEGTGWGTSLNTTTPNGSYLKWVGSAGVPMIFLQNFWGATLKKIRLFGNSTAKPSSAIEMSTTSTHTNTIYNVFEDIYIGNEFGFDTDVNSQFSTGILVSGVINGDSHIWSSITINNCDNEAIYVQNPNASNIIINRLNVEACNIGLRSFGTIQLNTAFFGNCTGYIYQLETAGKISVYQAGSEGCAALLNVNGNVTKFVSRDSLMQLQAGKVRSDGVMVSVGTAVGWHIDLENSGFQFNLGTDPTGPITLVLHNGATITTGYFRCVGCQGIYPNNLDFGTMVFTNDQRNVVYIPVVAGGQDQVPQQHFLGNWNRTEDRTFQSWRNDFAGKFNIFGGPLNVRQNTKPQFFNGNVTTSTGTGSTVYSYRVTALTYNGGETDATAAQTCTNAVTLSPGVNENKVQWQTDLGAYAYNIYGRTAGNEQLLATVTWDSTHGAVGVRGNATGLTGWIDDGTATPGVAFPTINTTGSASLDGPVSVGGLTITGNTVANLPASPVAGMIDYVTDSTTNVLGATVAGSGSIKTLVWYNGSAWQVISGKRGGNPPVTTTTNYSQTGLESTVIFNGSSSLTFTLLSASANSGLRVRVKTIAAQPVVSASSNVVPLAGGSATTAILSNTAGKWADLESDGTNWIITASN